MDYDLIFKLILIDNVNEFERLVNENESCLSVSFGRFPLLSTMILFNSKKLLKKYTEILLNKKEFIVTNEPYLLVKKFTSKAKKVTRLFYDRTIYPIDMLAILHKDSKVKKFYKITSSEILAECKFIKIYEIYNQKIRIKNRKLKISLPKISIRDSKIFRKYALVSFLCMLIILGSGAIVMSSIGLGTDFSYYKVFDEKGLINAINNNISLRLYDDISLKEETVKQISNFSGNIDGNNKTLTLDFENFTNLFNENNGVIENLNVVVMTENNLITDNIGLICNKNTGTISNLNIKFAISDDIVIQKTTKGSVSFCGVAYENTGTIKNVEVEINAVLTAIEETQGDAYFSGVCDKNYGKISYVNFKSSLDIVSTEVDMTSLAVNNFASGEINHCKNFVNFTQNNDIESWSPTIGGICINNYGKISYTENCGDIVISSTNTSGKLFSCLGAGIVVNNYNKVEKCLNKGNINIKSSIKTAQVGGIIAQGLVSDDCSTHSIISKCGNFGDFNVFVSSSDDESSTNSTYSYVGGIVAVSSFANNGNLIGTEIVDSFSCAKFSLNETKNINSGLVVGGCYGVAYISAISLVFNQIANNYCVIDTETQYQIGSIINIQNLENGVNMVENNIKSLSNMQELEQLEVYYDEI